MATYTCFTYPSQITWDFENPRAEDVRLCDIAWAMGHTNRFGGRVAAPYNDAQHSVLVHDLVMGRTAADWQASPPGDPAHVMANLPPEARRQAGAHALLHDAHEGYLTDLLGPLKQLLRSFGEPFGMLSPWDMLETRHDRVIFEAVGLGNYFGPDFPSLAQAPWYEMVHAADKLAYRIEANALRPSSPTYGDVSRLPRGRVLGPAEAADAFLGRCRDLELPTTEIPGPAVSFVDLVRLPFEERGEPHRYLRPLTRTP